MNSHNYHLLTDAITLATKAHAGQTDKAGAPYIFHPLRLMLGAANIDEQIVAVLHDVVEDTQYTLDDLQALGLTDPQLAALRLLTHDPAVAYEDYIRGIAPNVLARSVKLLDLADNMNLGRILSPSVADQDRIKKYEEAVKLLEAEI